jgi:SAM-dependent methyltransferase
MTSDRAGWSEPTLVQVSEDERTAAIPDPADLPDAVADGADPGAERAALADAPGAVAGGPADVAEQEHLAEQQAEQPAEAPPEPAAADAAPEPAADGPEPAADVSPEPVPAEPEPAPQTEPNPPVPEPLFTSVPISALPPPRRTATEYPPGELPSWREKLIERIADVAVATMPIPLRVLDVGCGDGRLLSELILRVPYAELYVALDPRPDAVPAQARAEEPRLSVVRGAAEALPLPDASFDLVLATLSLGLWLDQRAGVAELARVVSDNGKVIVVETKKPQSAGRHRAQTVKDISALLESAGLVVERVENVHRSLAGVSLAHAFIAAP